MRNFKRDRNINIYIYRQIYVCIFMCVWEKCVFMSQISYINQIEEGMQGNARDNDKEEDKRRESRVLAYF